MFVCDPPEPVRLPRRPLLSGVPSIAVLPLENLGGDPADLCFATRVIDDVVNSLAALPDLSVLARGATIGWRPRDTDPTVVGRVLGVRYVLSGGVRRGGGGIRIAADLRETLERSHRCGGAPRNFDPPVLGNACHSELAHCLPDRSRDDVSAQDQRSASLDGWPASGASASVTPHQFSGFSEIIWLTCMSFGTSWRGAT